MKGFFKSFVFAKNGMCALLKERNFRIQIVAFSLVIFAGFYFQITSAEWLIILLISSIVLSLEAINTAIEKLCDLYSKEEDSLIMIIKDVAAAAVLISALFSIVLAFIIFCPYIKALIN